VINKLSSLAAIALMATVPSLASADGVAASLSASFGGNSGSVSVLPPSGAGGVITTPQSVSVAGAAGGFAVASSVATASSSGAAAGATDDVDLTPLAEVTYNGGVGAYETTVSFAPSATTIAAVAAAASAQAIADLCLAGFAVSQDPILASQAGTTGVIVDDNLLVNLGFLGIQNSPAFIADSTINIVDGNITVSGGDVTVACN